jgi:porin
MKSMFVALLALGLWAGHAEAQEAQDTPVAVSGRYVVDVVAVAQGEEAGGYVLHNAELAAEADLDALLGAQGLTAGAHLLANFGGRPNDGAGTLQGINNIEVGAARAKIYEAWLEQSLADGVSLRLGLSDLNADFYQNDAAALLIAPAFGIGSELAATGPNGPSIFPSTALTARLRVALGEHGYARAAIVNARAGVIGDPDGVDFAMRDGALLIGEMGTTHGGKIALGLWRYTDRQDDIHDVTLAGTPVQRIAQGAYLLFDRQIAGDQDRGMHVFGRAGISEGRTTPFAGGVQLGVLMTGVTPGRPQSQLSFGVQYGTLSRGFADELAATGFYAGSHERGVELSYQDQLTPFLRVQPDIQYIRRTFASDGSRDVVVLGLRLIAAFGED